MAGKGFDAKAFLVNHTEKLVLGAAGLMVLVFLLGSQWSSYKGTPDDIKTNVSQSRAALDHPWPEDQQQLFAMTQKRTPKQVVHDNLRNPIAVSQYEMSTRFISSPWQGKEPLREPVLLALEEALVTPGKVLIERPFDPNKIEAEIEPDPKKPGSGKTDPDLAALPVTPDPDGDFAPDPASSEGLAGQAGPGSAPPMAAPAHATAPPSHAAIPGAHGAHGALSAYPAYGGVVVPMVSGPIREAQGYYFTSVRAVFRVGDQIRKFQDAIHAKSMDQAAFAFEVIDFNLERQELIGQTKNWSEWQPVDTQSALDVLGQSMPPEPDIVSGMVTNNVITMPLPPRIYGNWRKYGSHPKIDNFVLTDEQVEMEIEFQSRMLELMRESQTKSAAKPLRKQPGGFSPIIGDSRAVQAQVFDTSQYGSSSAMGSFNANPAGSRGSGRQSPAAANRGASSPDAVMKKLLETKDKGEISKALAEYIKERVTANGELLLFRYMDFTVESGKTYRYRVRLVLNNPNYGHLASEANGDALVVQGETRTTEWSNVTEPATIERDIYYFVKDVDSRSNKSKVTLYQWDTKLGTTVNADLDLYPGQHIAGAVKTSVINPAKSTYKEDEPYTFTSSDVYVDTNADVSLDRTLHKDLKLPGGSKGDVLLPEEVLVVQSNTGELAILDPIRQGAEQRRLEDNQKKQAEHFASLKGLVLPETTEMGDMTDPYASAHSAGKASSGKGGRARNPLVGGSTMGPGMGMGSGSGSGMGAPGGRRQSPRGQQP